MEERRIVVKGKLEYLATKDEKYFSVGIPKLGLMADGTSIPEVRERFKRLLSFAVRTRRERSNATQWLDYHGVPWVWADAYQGTPQVVDEQGKILGDAKSE